MTDAPRDAKIETWRLAFSQRLAEGRTQFADEAQARAARPKAVRRNAASLNRRRTAGPADAAQQARQDEEWRRLCEARAQCLNSLEAATADVASMMADAPLRP